MLVVDVCFVIICIIIIMCFCNLSYFVSVFVCVFFFLILFLCFFFEFITGVCGLRWMCCGGIVAYYVEYGVVE